MEQDADRRARDYFGEEVWDYKENPIFDSGKNWDFDRDYGKSATDRYPNLNSLRSDIISLSIKNKGL